MRVVRRAVAPPVRARVESTEAMLWLGQRLKQCFETDALLKYTPKDEEMEEATCDESRVNAPTDAIADGAAAEDSGGGVRAGTVMLLRGNVGVGKSVLARGFVRACTGKCACTFTTTCSPAVHRLLVVFTDSTLSRASYC